MGWRKGQILRSTKNVFIMWSQSRIFDHSSTPIWASQKILRGKIIQGEWRNFHRPRTLFLACRILDSVSLIMLYVHEHARLCFWKLTVETAVFDCIWWFSSRDRKSQSYPVEYCLKSVEEYSGGKIHKGEPEPLNRNVNTVYFINQARRNTWISRTEFV